MYTKKIFFAVVCLTGLNLAVLLSGCSSVPVYFADYSPVAIISVTGNPALPWKDVKDGNDEGDDGNGILTNMVNKIIDGNNPELLTGQNRIDYAAQAMHELLASNGGTEVIDHDSLVSSTTYKNTVKNTMGVLSAIYPATDYRDLSKVGAKRARMIMAETHTRGLIIAEFFFQKVNCSGNKWSGKVCAAVTMKVSMRNEHGNEIVSREFYATSPEQIQISDRKYDKNALVDLYPATIDAVINQFIVSYVK